MRKLDEYRSNETFGRYTPEIERAIKLLEDRGIIDYGNAGSESEFFLIRLKDKYAQAALYAYAEAALPDDAEYANEVIDMAKRSGEASPWCKAPD
jgi:hypothetical protein